MAIDPFLVEAQWKAKGLSLRTNGEKLKFKKTGVSEALHLYAVAAALPVGGAATKKTRLQAVKAAVVKCKNDHRNNTAFVAYVDNVDKGITREVTRSECGQRGAYDGLEQWVMSSSPPFWISPGRGNAKRIWSFCTMSGQV